MLTDRCQLAPDNPETGYTKQSTRGRSRDGNFGGGCQREKRPKRYQQVAEPRRLLSQQKHIHKNWLGLQQTAAATRCHRCNNSHYLTFRWDLIADPMDGHGLPRHPTRSPEGAHGIPRGRPWSSMVEHVGFRGRPPKVPWDPTGVATAAHGNPCGRPWQPTWQKRKKKIVLKASVVTTFHAVIWWLVIMLDDLVHLLVYSKHGQAWHPMAAYDSRVAAHGIPWHPMASRVIPWQPTWLPMASHGSPHGIPCQLMASHGILRHPMLAHGIPWHPMASHASSWHPTASHGIPWQPT